MSLYDNFFYSEKINRVFSEKNQIAAMLCFEIALAQAQARCGVISNEAASEIEKVCQIKNIDIKNSNKI